MKDSIKIYAVKARVTPTSKDKSKKFKPAFRVFSGIVIDDLKRNKEQLNDFTKDHIISTLNLKDGITYKVQIIEIIDAGKNFIIQTKPIIS